MDERQHLPVRRVCKHPGSDQTSKNENPHMNPFTYSRATDTGQAVTAISGKPHGKFLGGGTNLIDLMKMGVETPDELIDINRLPLAQIEELSDKRVRIGALARNSDVAEHELIKSRYPVLSEALLSGASPQLRNMATVGGNLLQRTRCYYFYDPAFPACNKRKPGSGCGALEGYNRIHAILGQSEQCIATNPSDMSVALAALDAVVRVHGTNGEREILFGDFHRLPGNTPGRDTNLAPDELIIAVDLPAIPFATRSHYLKVRDRAGYAFALVSVAAALELGSNKKIKNVRLALGGVAHKPWRANAAEKELLGKDANEKSFRAAAEVELAAAKGYKHNSYKIELAKRSIVRALNALTEMTS
jgi:xanthine dehydrogenase YagS FAD-binding subunit